MADQRLFQMDDLELTLPAGFADKSAQLLEWQVDGGVVALGIQRDSSPKRPSAEQLAAKLKQEYERRLPQYFAERFEHEELSLEQEHRLLALRWRRDGKSVFQVQAFVEHGDRLLVLTASGDARQRAFIAELMVATLRDLQLRETDA